MNPFPVFQIFVPVVICCCVAICCASFCKIFHRSRMGRSQNQAPDSSASVYVIPIPVSNDELHRPPRYSTAQLYDPPPAYNQVKPEVLPMEPPPPYTEAISDSPYS